LAIDIASSTIPFLTQLFSCAVSDLVASHRNQEPQQILRFLDFELTVDSAKKKARKDRLGVID
jgi:hypothetical protein